MIKPGADTHFNSTIELFSKLSIWMSKGSILCSRGQILLFQGWLIINILCLNHSGILIILIQNLKCLKNAAWGCRCRDDTVQPLWGLWVSVKYIHDFTHVFSANSRHFRFSMGIIKVPRWFGHKILILKHPWKSKIWPLEQSLGLYCYQTFLFMHPEASLWHK